MKQCSPRNSHSPVSGREIEKQTARNGDDLKKLVLADPFSRLEKNGRGSERIV
jgi:hypothetical protein